MTNSIEIPDIKIAFCNIDSDTQCNCLHGAEEDIEHIYCRKIDTSTIKERDFKTHWERGKREYKGQTISTNDCKAVCDLKAISTNIIKNNEHVEHAIKKYLKTCSLSPSKAKSSYLCKFKFKDHAGKVKHSPELDDHTHYNFFKADTFSINRIEVISINRLDEYVQN